MSNLVNKAIVLTLNKSWQPIGVCTVGEAFTSLLGGKRDVRGNSTPPALAMDIDFVTRLDGTLDTSKLLKAVPTSYVEWCKLPVREHEEGIMTSRGEIRVPTILIQQHYAEMPTVTPKFSPAAVRKRDRSTCQYSGEVVGADEGNLDHVIPRHMGGKDCFENVVWSKRKINSLKGGKTNAQAGIKLLRKPVAPPKLPKSATIRQAAHPHWEHFLVAKD